MEDGRQQLHSRERIDSVLPRRASAREERLQRLGRELDHVLAVDAADPAPLHGVVDRVEHAELHGSVCTTTSAMPGTASRTRSSTALARACASERDASPPRPSVRKATRPSSVPTKRSSRGATSGLRPHDLLDGFDVHVDLARGGRLGQRLQVRAHVLDLGDRRENRALDLLGDVVRPFELEIARKLEMERDLDAPVHLEDGQVVDLAHLRNAQGCRQSALTNLRIRAPRLHVHDDVGMGKPLADRVLDPVRRSMALADRGAGRDPDDDVREVPAARLAHAEPPELDRRVERVDRRTGRVLRVDRGLIHEHVHVAPQKAHRSRDDERRDEERGHRVSSGKPECRRGQPGEHGERPGEVAPEVQARSRASASLR